MAATNIHKDALAQLHAILQRMPAAQAHPDQYLAIDHEFHMHICHAADNRILDRIMYASRGLTTASRHMPNTGSRPLATKAHTRIYQAIAAGDADGAREAMRVHLQGSRPVPEKNRRKTARTS
jgi:DNA-binding FadR family transcriptional regulator